MSTEIVRSGLEEGVPYSLSRWTDVPISKWFWFLQALKDGAMEAFHPNSTIPSWWSLRPDKTLSLTFWTKDPTNLIQDMARFQGYRVKVHLTATGWHEVEKGAPSIEDSSRLLQEVVAAFGIENVTWRFSPIPALTTLETLSRFQRLSTAAHKAGLRQVFVSFLQANDRIPERRTRAEKMELLSWFSSIAQPLGLDILLCNEDRLLANEGGRYPMPPNLRSGVCAPVSDYGSAKVQTEACGCVLMADPFTFNESCSLGCLYCYASDASLSSKKRNTTKHLKVIR